MRSFDDDHILGGHPILIDGLQDILTLRHGYFRGHFYQMCTYLILGHSPIFYG